jgi:hypothetical protein
MLDYDELKSIKLKALALQKDHESLSDSHQVLSEKNEKLK